MIANFFKEELVIPRLARIVLPPENLKINDLIDPL